MYVLLIQFLGEGIFNSDGEQWAESRALLRPQFLKQRVSDLAIFERHTGKMLSMLPRDGRTVELMDWWFRMTLDAGTEYLFGKSVDSLDNPKVLS
jgi:cytochrome P450